MQTELTALDLARVLHPDDRVFIIQDGVPRTCAAVGQDAARLREFLATFPACRVALTSQRADRIVAALAACQSSGCELLLLREIYDYDDPVWESWGVAYALSESLSIEHTFPWTSRLAQNSAPRVLLTTSGTTGKPKVAFHSFAGLLGRIANMKLDAARWLLTFHPASFAGLQVLLTALISESELVATSEPSVPNLANLLYEYQPSHVSGTPTFWRALLLALGSRNRSVELKQITIGGEAVDQATLDTLREAFTGARIIHIYASTEAGALFAVKDGQAGFPAQWLDEGVEGVELRISEGLLEARSPRSMERYLIEPTSKAQTQDGWIMTGDLVEKIGDRVLFRGRADDVINVGGAKVRPEEVEATLLKMPLVKEVRVFGKRNPISGAVVAAEIVVPPGTDENNARQAIYFFAKGHLESFKIPRILKFVPDISVNTSGKKSRER